MKYTPELLVTARKSIAELGKDSSCAMSCATLSAFLDEIERLQAESAWIPVSERLPEDNVVVIACNWSSEAGFVFPSWFKDGKFHYQAEMLYECETTVTHWKPLPIPPVVT